MSFSVEVNCRCSECHGLIDEDDPTFCGGCFEALEGEPSAAAAQVRAYADRQKLLGLLSADAVRVLEECAVELEATS